MLGFIILFEVWGVGLWFGCGFGFGFEFEFGLSLGYKVRV